MNEAMLVAMTTTLALFLVAVAVMSCVSQHLWSARAQDAATARKARKAQRKLIEESLKAHIEEDYASAIADFKRRT